MNLLTRFSRVWIWVLSLGFVLFLISTNSVRQSDWNPAEQLIIEICTPFQGFITHSVNIIEDFWSNYFQLVDVSRKNRELRKEIDALRMENSRYREMLASYKRLRKLLQFKQTIHWPVLAARVTGFDPTGWFKSIIIDKGKLSGLSLNMPVVNAYGVVGRIVSVSPDYAKVLLIIDQNSAVDCLVQRSRDRGMVKGLSSEICKLDYVVKSSDVKAEDIVVTSGLGGIFPKGLPVGRVQYVKDVSGGLFKEIGIRPLVDFSKLEEVLVILKEDGPSSHQPER